MAAGLPVAVDDVVDPKEQGFLAAGGPIGTPEFIKAHVERVLGDVAAKLRGIVTLRDTAQADVEQSVQLLARMVRYCVAPKPHHLFRTTPVQHTEEMAGKVDTLITDTMLDLLDVKNLTADVKPRVIEQLHLAVAKGGFGIRSAAANAPVAYLASRADTAELVARAAPVTMEAEAAVDAAAAAAVAAPAADDEEAEPEQLRPLLASAVTDALAARQRIADSATASSVDPTRFTVEPVARLERKVGQEQDEARAVRVLDGFKTKRDKEMFLGGTTSDAGAWLDAAGTYASRTVMSDIVYKTAAQLRLQTLSFHGYCANCSNVPAGRLVPHSHHHALVCSKMAGHRNRRHNVIRDTLVQIASRIPDADVASEPHVHSELHYARKAGGDKNDDGSDIDHRGDAWIRASDKQAEHKWLVDVTVVHPPRPSNDAASAAEPGAAAETAAAKKVDTYTRNYTIPSEVVVPVAFETVGRINDSAVVFLKQLAWLLFRTQKEGSGMPRPRAFFRRMLGERLSVALQRGNARMVNVYRTAGGARVKGSYRWDLTTTEVAAAREAAGDSDDGVYVGGGAGAGAGEE